MIQCFLLLGLQLQVLPSNARKSIRYCLTERHSRRSARLNTKVYGKISLCILLTYTITQILGNGWRMRTTTPAVDTRPSFFAFRPIRCTSVVTNILHEKFGPGNKANSQQDHSTVSMEQQVCCPIQTLLGDCLACYPGSSTDRRSLPYSGSTKNSIFSNTSSICISCEFNQMCGRFPLLPFLCTLPIMRSCTSTHSTLIYIHTHHLHNSKLLIILRHSFFCVIIFNCSCRA